MAGILPRVLGAVSAVAVGAGLGWVLGDALAAAAVGSVAGGAMGGLAWVVRDAWLGERLVDWLRRKAGGQGDVPAPMLTGVWGDLAYRLEKILREQDRRDADGQARLAQFVAAIDASPNGVLLLDRDDGIDWCNRVAADHLGIDPRRDVGQRLTNLVRSPAFVGYLQQRPHGAPVTVVSPDGRGSLLVQARAFGEGRTLLLTQDITERERADAMRRDFVANVSHEIRTPLTVLAGFVETLQSMPLTEVERARVLQLMGQQTDRMQLLVADLLTLARLEGSPRPPSDQWVPLATVLQQAVGDAGTLSAGRHWIDLEPPRPEVELAGNEVELQSAVGNLLGNAVRYTPDEGRIDVRWLDRHDGGCIEVRDTGIGVAREHIARLTERFYRVDGSRARETGGTGLGLSIVKHVMQRHGGQIEIESEPGKGSCFRLVFPAARVRRAAALAGLTAPRGATRT